MKRLFSLSILAFVTLPTLSHAGQLSTEVQLTGNVHLVNGYNVCSASASPLYPSDSLSRSWSTQVKLVYEASSPTDLPPDHVFLS